METAFKQPLQIESRGSRDMHLEALVSDAFAEALGRVVAEKQKEFDAIIALREAEFRLHKEQMLIMVRDALDLVNAKLATVKNGKDGEPGLPGRDGADGVAGKEGPQGQQGLPGTEGPAGPIGFDGPVGATGPQGEKGLEGAVGAAGPQGLQGLSGAEGQRGFQGEPGRDGMPGRDGLNGLQGERGEAGKSGRDGINGIDGKDGAGFDGLDCKYDGERQLVFEFGSGDRVKKFEIALPVPIYRGKWKDGAYHRGDEVTLGGQIFRAVKDTEGKPSLSDNWSISANRGRDGRDGKDGAMGPQGPEGRPGRDLTQLGPDGKKW